MSTILPSKLGSSKRNFSRWLMQTLDRDYFPSVEPYIAWLRQPVGWFVLATVASILVGVTVSPVALSVAAGLISLLGFGMLYPWLAVRLIRCEIVSAMQQLEEDATYELQVKIRNLCPWPLWGLIIEGLVVSPSENDPREDDSNPCSDIALASVSWLSQATYGLTLQPRFRGRYPQSSPHITCAFPFGLWTARRTIHNVAPLVVVPKQIKLHSQVEHSGRVSHHGGTGTRSGGNADFLGIRDYRIGDSTRHIHWAHTARMDSIVVCERSLTEQTPWQVVLDPRVTGRDAQTSRENLAWRVRMAASLCTMLYQQSVSFNLVIYGEETWSNPTHRREGNRLQHAIERLTDVPLDGLPPEQWNGSSSVSSTCTLLIDLADEPISDDESVETLQDHTVRLRLNRASSTLRQSNHNCTAIIDLDQAISAQINSWLQRVDYARPAA